MQRYNLIFNFSKHIFALHASLHNAIKMFTANGTILHAHVTPNSWHIVCGQYP